MKNIFTGQTEMQRVVRAKQYKLRECAAQAYKTNPGLLNPKTMRRFDRNANGFVAWGTVSNLSTAAIFGLTLAIAVNSLTPVKTDPYAGFNIIMVQLGCLVGTVGATIAQKQCLNRMDAALKDMRRDIDTYKNKQNQR